MASSVIIKFTEDQKHEILKGKGSSKSHLEEQIKVIQNWVKTQPHIPEAPEDAVVERFLLMNKFRIEKVKERITMYFAVRTTMPDMFNVHRMNPNMVKCKKSFDFVTLPELTPDFGRVILFRLTDDANDQFDMTLYIAYTLLIAEIRMREDIRAKDIFIYDMKNVKFSHLTKLTPVIIKKLTLITQKLYADNGTIINLINVAPILNSFMGMLKSLNPPKVQERFFVHSNLESLYKIVPKDYLPTEYEGNAGTIAEITELWEKKIEEYESVYEHLRSIRIDKDLLPENLKIDDNFGVHGNFKKLDVD